MDPLRWLAAQTGEDRFYWSGRSETDALAGIGRVVSVEGTSSVDYDSMRRDVRQILDNVPAGARLFGGIRFGRRTTSDSDWSDFPSYRLILPRFELRTLEDSSLLICNIAPGERAGGSMVQSEIDALATPEASLSVMPSARSRADAPAHRDWVRDIEWALEAFSSTTLAKVVLARRARFEFEADLDPFALMSRLLDATPSCYHFLFSHGDGTFLGASPERLFRQDGRRIQSEAVAGTGTRGTTEGADEALGNELLHSEKDQREHEYVRQSIKEALTDLTRMLHVDTTATDMKLAVGRHLLSRVDGVLKPGVDAFDLLQSLHPTPAVGGYPYEEAIDVIEHLEPFDRGWYAGPVGWIGRDSAEFAVGIRSGRIVRNRLDLFSGAGIVCGSDPELEWHEVEQKIGDFLRVIAP
ncbi:MAG: isochorismate synthase [Rhodothermales bacterium]|nr:isochorismate synthase [Rhodothermales bacterium]